MGLSSPVYAYMDPGAVSLMIQSVVGAIAAGIVVLKVYWASITSFVSKLIQKNKR